MELAHKYRDGGSELVFFLHGLGCSKESFSRVWEMEGYKKYSLLAVDMAGHGGSPRPEDFSYSMEAHADACISLLKGKEFKKLHIAAHSMGGAVGLLLADELPDRLASFVSVEGNLTGADCGLVSRKTAMYPEADFAGVKFSRFIEANEKASDPSLRLWAGMLRKCSPLAFHKSAASLVEWSDSGKLLEKFLELRCRKAYIYGERNSGMDVLSMMKSIETISVPGSGHFVMNDNPEGFYSDLLGFFGGR
jgi:pimeloyl-ACP methyl ester carboxylesterase